MSRFDYVKYDLDNQQAQHVFKITFETIAECLEAMPPSREVSLALTKLEESYMWIGKALRDDQIKRNGSAPLQEERKDG